MKTSTEYTDLTWRAFLTLSLFAAIMLVPEMALAAAPGGVTPMETVMCNMVAWMTGATGRAIATIGIIIIGIGALLGKVSWGVALIVAIGVAMVFGSATLVGLLGGSTTACAPNATIVTGVGG